MEFQLFDADNHYYEAEDAFTRYASERMKASRYVRWLTEADGKRRRLFFGDREARVIGNPTFDPVMKPGAFHTALKNLQSTGVTPAAQSYGELVPISPAYRDRDARLSVMDRQGVEKAIFFPTLGVTVEGLIQDREMLYDCLHAFNRWLDDDWGFAYRDRIFAVPYLSLLDVDRAIAELEWVLARGARAITIRPGPAYGRSPADPHFDPFWARVDEAGVVVTYHAYEGPSAYSEWFREAWAAPPRPLRPEDLLLQRAVASLDAAILDTMCALVLQNLLVRFPRLRIATVEVGCSWVGPLLHRLDHAAGFAGSGAHAFGHKLPAKPSEIFREKVWVAPFPEEDVAALVELMGVDRVLMGTDWPHAEGTPEPRDYLPYLEDFDPASVRRIARDNALELFAA